MYILIYYFKPENQTDNSDFTKFLLKSALYQIYKNYPSDWRGTWFRTTLVFRTRLIKAAARWGETIMNAQCCPTRNYVLILYYDSASIYINRNVIVVLQ